MRTTTFGQSGPEVGVIGLGCMGMTFGYDQATPRNHNEMVSVIRRAVELGCTHIDTAEVYGPLNNEELVGEALDSGLRDRVVLATKTGWNIPHALAGNGLSHDGRPETIRASIDGSLRRLRTDVIDVWYLHRVDPNVPLEETWGAMADVVESGKVRQLGICEVTVDQLEKIQQIHPVGAVQSELSLWTRDFLSDVVPYTEAHGIAFVPFGPLARGLFTDRFKSIEDIPQDDSRRHWKRFQPETFDENLKLVDTVRGVAERIGATPGQVALAWCVQQGKYVIPIPGTKTPRYLEENAGAGDIVLSEDDMAVLNAMPAPAGGRY